MIMLFDTRKWAHYWCTHRSDSTDLQSEVRVYRCCVYVSYGTGPVHHVKQQCLITLDTRFLVRLYVHGWISATSFCIVLMQVFFFNLFYDEIIGKFYFTWNADWDLCFSVNFFTKLWATKKNHVRLYCHFYFMLCHRSFIFLVAIRTIFSRNIKKE